MDGLPSAMDSLPSGDTVGAADVAFLGSNVVRPYRRWRLYTIFETGELLEVMHGFTAVTGLTFDGKGRMYVEELSTAPKFPMPGTGKVVRVGDSGQIEDFLTGLVVPTGLTYHDGALYISNFGAAPASGGHELGKILRVTIPD